jgi:hypothetical protein
MLANTGNLNNSRISSLLQQYKTNADILIKHQLDSQLNNKEALALTEGIILANTQIITEIYNLYNDDKDAANKELEIIAEIYCTLKQTSVEIQVCVLYKCLTT